MKRVSAAVPCYRIIQLPLVPVVNREEFDGCPCLRGNFCRSGKRVDGSYEPISWAPVKARYSELEALGYILLTE